MSWLLLFQNGKPCIDECKNTDVLRTTQHGSCASMLLYKCCYICVQDSVFGTLSIFRQVHNRENLGQTSGDYPVYRQNLGWSRKSKIPDRLGFSRDMKNRLYPIYRQNLGWWAKKKNPRSSGIFPTYEKTVFSWLRSLHSWRNNRPFLGIFFVFFFFFFILWLKRTPLN